MSASLVAIFQTFAILMSVYSKIANELIDGTSSQHNVIILAQNRFQNKQINIFSIIYGSTKCHWKRKHFNTRMTSKREKIYIPSALQMCNHSEKKAYQYCDVIGGRCLQLPTTQLS